MSRLRLPKLDSQTSQALHQAIVRDVAAKYSRVSGDHTIERFARDWNVPLMLQRADSLAAVVHGSAAIHFAANQVASLIRKYPFSEQESGLRPEATAVTSFLESEERCKAATSRLRASSDARLERMRRYIRYVIGDEPSDSWIDLCDYTSGASLGVHGNSTHLARKLQVEKITVTPTALPYYITALNRNRTYNERFCIVNGNFRSADMDSEKLLSHVQTVSYNKLAFVPKTAKTHRSIAVEPLGNSYLQKGLDQYLRHRLKRVGVDLSDQSKNQRLAHEGSLTGELATIDLSSASDSVSIGLCKAVLPPAWFSLLNCTRSPAYIYGGDPIRYEKFVTMGNGFCFPLQSLLFSAMLHAVGATNVARTAVYGDDIIVPVESAEKLSDLLAFCGFLLNEKKTHTQGPFRESCGSNWYNGEDVNTYTLSSPLVSLGDLYKFVNLSRRNLRTSDFLLEARRKVVARIDPDYLFWRPYKGASDTGLDLDPDICVAPTFGYCKNLQSPRWKELVYTSVYDRRYNHSPEWVQLAGILRNSDVRFAVRRKTRTRVRTVARSCDEI